MKFSIKRITNMKIFYFLSEKDVASFDTTDLTYVNVFFRYYSGGFAFASSSRFLRRPFHFAGAPPFSTEAPKLSAPDEEFDIEKKSSLLPEERCPFDAEA